ncbi:hypothetical protein [Alteromonas sp. CYL-A6]|uniref:hypothetical protein n=1 Tax=Alteromonas nitratireducens TaxID=3390813 RepID=UPI0034B50E95
MAALTPQDSTKDIEISPDFQQVKEKLSGFSVASFNDPEQVNRYVDCFDLRTLCQQVEADRLASQHSALSRTVSAFEEKPFEPEYDDLCRLHYLVLSRKCVNIMEFGSGFSTVVMAHAVKLLHQHFEGFARAHFRANQFFHVYSVEEEQRFLEITNQRLSSRFSPFATVNRSSVEMITHDNRIATIYRSLPDISPDFIYLDGPSLFGTTAEINGFTMTNPCRMPMSADILRFEFFLEPGTLILVDGRTANARFLRSYLRRNWAYHHDKDGDIHYFELQEDALGKINQTKLDFCLDNTWLLPL